MNKLNEIQYFNNKIPGNLNKNILFYFSFDSGNSIILPTSGRIGPNQQFLFSGQILPSTGNFWSSSGYGYIKDNYIQINNTNNLINLQNFTFICAYDNISKTGATLLSTVSQNNIQSFDKFGNPFNEKINIGFEFGFTSNNRLFFEFYDVDGPKVFISNFDLADKSSVFLDVANKSATFGYYDFIKDSLISNTFNFNSEFIFNPTGLFIGKNPISSNTYNYNKQFEGYLEQLVFCSPKIFRYEIENINKSFISNYTPKTQFINQTFLTGLLGFSSIKTGLTIELAQKLTGNFNTEFGHNIATNIDGTIIMIGNPKDNQMGNNAGAASIYTGNSTVGWQLRQKLTGDSPNDFFGHSVAMNDNGTVLIMGGIYDSDGGVNAGASLIFTGDVNNGWNLRQKLTGDAYSQFSYSLAMNNDASILIMGSPLSNSENKVADGAGIIYTGTSVLGWQLKQKLTGINTNDLFGHSVAMNNNGTVLMIGGIGNDDAGAEAGAALVYTGNMFAGWHLRQKLTGSGPNQNFGYSVATNNNGSVLMMGGIRNDDGGTDAGGAFIYTGSSTLGWKLQQKLTGDNANDGFGKSVASNGDGTILIMGGIGDDDGGTDAGGAFIYTGSSTLGWKLQQKLTGDNANDGFGKSITMNEDGTILMVGKTGNNIESVFIYNLNFLSGGAPVTGFLYGITGYTEGILDIQTGVVTGIEYIQTGIYTDEFGNEAISYQEVELLGNVVLTGFVPLSGILSITNSGIIDENIFENQNRISEFSKNHVNILSDITHQDIIEIQTITGNYTKQLYKNLTSFYNNVNKSYVFEDIKSAPNNRNYTLFANGLLTTSGTGFQTGSIYSSSLFIASGDYVTNKKGEFSLFDFDGTHNVFADFITGDIIVENNFSKNNSGILNNLDINNYNAFINGQKLINISDLFLPSNRFKYEITDKIIGLGATPFLNKDENIFALKYEIPFFSSEAKFLIYTGNLINGTICNNTDIFRNNCSEWNFKTFITGSINDNFTSLAFSDDNQVIAMGCGNTFTSGYVLIWTGNRTNGWKFKQRINGTRIEGAFGFKIQFTENNSLYISSPGRPIGPPFNTGYIDIYTGNNNNGWFYKDSITGSYASDLFGENFKVKNNILIASRSKQPSNDNTFPASMVYTGSNDKWSLKTILTGAFLGTTSIVGPFGPNINSPTIMPSFPNHSFDWNSSGTMILIGDDYMSCYPNTGIIIDTNCSESVIGFPGGIFVYTGNPNFGWVIDSVITGIDQRVYENCSLSSEFGTLFPTFGTNIGLVNDDTIFMVGGNAYRGSGTTIVYKKNLNPDSGKWPITSKWTIFQEFTGENGYLNKDGKHFLSSAVGDNSSNIHSLLPFGTGDLLKSGKLIFVSKNFNYNITGSKNLFSINKYYNNSTQVYKNGVRQTLNFDYFENGKFTLNNGIPILDIKSNSIYNNNRLF